MRLVHQTYFGTKSGVTNSDAEAETDPQDSGQVLSMCGVYRIERSRKHPVLRSVKIVLHCSSKS